MTGSPRTSIAICSLLACLAFAFAGAGDSNGSPFAQNPAGSGKAQAAAQSANQMHELENELEKLRGEARDDYDRGDLDEACRTLQIMDTTIKTAKYLPRERKQIWENIVTERSNTYKCPRQQRRTTATAWSSDDEKALSDSITTFYMGRYPQAQEKLRKFVSDSRHSSVSLAIAYFYLGASAASEYYLDRPNDMQKKTEAQTYFGKAKENGFGDTLKATDISSKIKKLYDEPIKP